MTATEPSREASPAPSTSSSTSSTRSLPPCSAWPPLACLHRRKEKLCHTDLPVRSAPGVWLLVGVGVVLVGMCVAVAGYASATPKPPQGGRGASHADRMKLAGPVVMGVGLFIFICSATLLYENRDSALLAPRAGPGDGDPVLGAEDEEEEEEEGEEGEEGVSPQRPCCREQKHHHHHHHHNQRCSGDPELGSWESSLSFAPSLCGDNGNDDDDDADGDPGSQPLTPGRGHSVISVSDAPGGRGGWSMSPAGGEGHGKGGGGGGAGGQNVGVMVVEVEVEEEGEVGARLLTCVVHHQEPPGPSSLPSPSLDSASCNSSEVDFNIRMLLTPPPP